MAEVGIIGAGSIGATLARGFDGLGHEVYINDTDNDRLRALDFPARSKGLMAATCDYLVLALPTPTTDAGGDPSIVDAALGELGQTDATIIIRSTMPPGSTRELADTHGLPLVYSPEFLRDRAGVDAFYNPDRIVLAGPQPQRRAARDLLADPDIDCSTYITTDDYLTAEIAKEAHNAFFATKVSFANQMRLVCEREGADVETVMDVVTADHRNTDSHLDPLLGPYGGKCLPKDTKALTLYADAQGAATPLLRGVIDLNQRARERYDDVTIEGEWPDISVRGD